MRHRDRISFGLLATALITAVMIVGGAQRGTQALVAALVASAIAVQLFAKRRLGRVSPLLVFLGIAIALTAIQLIPMPAGVREALVPQGEVLRRDGAALAGTSPWPSLSLDPAGTLRALCFLLTLAGVAAVATRFATTERGRYGLLAAVAATCGLAAAATGIHALVNADALYGVYEPQHATPPVLGPLLNANHMGSLMALGTVLAGGLAFYTRQKVHLRVTWIVVAFACLLVLLGTLSRGAVLALAFGAVVAGAALVAQRFDGGARHARRSDPLRSQLPIAIVIAFGLGLVIYSSASNVAGQLDNTSLTELSQPSSKYAAWKSSVQLILENPWLGIGRGALEPVFTRVHDPAAFVTFSHLENEYLQAIVEWGVLGAVLLAGAFGWALLKATRRWRDGPLAAAALGAIAGVLLQSAVDFGIELLGLAVPMTIVAASLLPVPLREPRERTARASSLAPIGAVVFGGRVMLPLRPLVAVMRVLVRPVVVRTTTILALAASALLVVQPFARSLQEDHDVLVDGEPTLDQIRATIERHPLDYFAFGQAAGIQMRDASPQAASYLNHAMLLHPSHPGLHRLAARMLVASDRRDQAAVQYALALKGSTRPRRLLTEILVLLPDPDQAALAIPTDRSTVELMARTLSELERPDVTLRWLSRVIARPQRDVAVVDRMYKLALEQRELGFAELAARTRRRIARTTTSRLMLARVLVLQRKPDAVLAELADVAGWRGRIDEKTEAWLFVCDIYLQRRQWDEALSCLHRLEGSGAVTPGQRIEVTRRLNQVKEQRTLEEKEHAIRAMEEKLKGTPRQP